MRGSVGVCLGGAKDRGVIPAKAGIQFCLGAELAGWNWIALAGILGGFGEGHSRFPADRNAGAMTAPPADPAAFIRSHLHLATVPDCPGIRLYAPDPRSGLGRLAGPPPYWAYAWAGGAALARHFLDRPESVCGRRVLDLGAGGGIVGIAAAKAGAASVTAAEIDRNGLAAIGLNAEANGVKLKIIGRDLTRSDPPPGIGLVAVGDLFYSAALARRVAAFLDRCLATGAEVLVGDPGRTFLPHARLEPVAEYAVPDFGDGGSALKPSTVFAYR
jgi:predicted nicotinamide N-methyase